MSEMPDFEPTHPAPMFEDPKPKKPRRKPAKRKAARKAVVPPFPKKRVVKKRKAAKRRGRPVGALNKPKAADQHNGGRYSTEVYDTIGKLMGMKGSDRDAVLDIVKGLAK